jgi:hypothetical protein
MTTFVIQTLYGAEARVKAMDLVSAIRTYCTVWSCTEDNIRSIRRIY